MRGFWIVGARRGDARRLTSAVGTATNPAFSPDGTWIAFTANFAGNPDVYVVAASGGQPRRLTYHPGTDQVVGGLLTASALFLVPRGRATTASVDDCSRCRLRAAFLQSCLCRVRTKGSLSPDGSKIAYVPHGIWQPAWKRYRGGQTSPIWIATLADSSVVDRIPRENSNDKNPMWVGKHGLFPLGPQRSV